MRRLHIGIGAVRSLTEGTEIIVYFAPAYLPTGSIAGSSAQFPQWRAKIKRCDDDALVVDLNGKIIGLSWDHIAALQFA